MRKLFLLLSLFLLAGCVVGGSFGMGNHGAGVGVATGITF